MIDERHEELAALHALDLLDGAERADFESALARDPALQLLVRELRESSASLAHTAPAAAPPAELRARVLASVDKVAVETSKSKIVAFPSWLPWAAAACFAAVAAWLGQGYIASRAEVSLLGQQQAIADLALKSARNQLETERLLARQRLADLDQQMAESTHQLADATARLTTSDKLLADAHRELDTERGLSRQRLADLEQQLAAELAKSGDAARQAEDAKKMLAQLTAQLNDETQRVAAVETKAQHDTDLANFKITTLASMLKNSPQALAVAVWNPATQEGVLRVDKLPALAANKDYQLWLVDPQYPNPVDGGVFTVDAQTGVARVQFKAKQPVKAINAFAVTLERKGGVPKAEGPFVLLGK